MLVIGLTGGIGTGKSEAARHMVSLGATLIDADLVGHEAYQPHAEAWRQVVGAFGEGILQPNGEIDRRSLGAIVFSDPEQLARLNGIMHPLMARMVQERIDGLRADGADVVVVEAALLYEAGWDSLVQEVWVTDASEEAVIHRLGTKAAIAQMKAQGGGGSVRRRGGVRGRRAGHAEAHLRRRSAAVEPAGIGRRQPAGRGARC